MRPRGAAGSGPSANPPRMQIRRLPRPDRQRGPYARQFGSVPNLAERVSHHAARNGHGLAQALGGKLLCQVLDLQEYRFIVGCHGGRVFVSAGYETDAPEMGLCGRFEPGPQSFQVLLSAPDHIAIRYGKQATGPDRLRQCQPLSRSDARQACVATVVQMAASMPWLAGSCLPAGKSKISTERSMSLGSPTSRYFIPG